MNQSNPCHASTTTYEYTTYTAHKTTFCILLHVPHFHLGFLNCLVYLIPVFQKRAQERQKKKARLERLNKLSACKNAGGSGGTERTAGTFGTAGTGETGDTGETGETGTSTKSGAGLSDSFFISILPNSWWSKNHSSSNNSHSSNSSRSIRSFGRSVMKSSKETSNGSIEVPNPNHDRTDGSLTPTRSPYRKRSEGRNSFVYKDGQRLLQLGSIKKGTTSSEEEKEEEKRTEEGNIKHIRFSEKIEAVGNISGNGSENENENKRDEEGSKKDDGREKDSDEEATALLQAMEEGEGKGEGKGESTKSPSPVSPEDPQSKFKSEEACESKISGRLEEDACILDNNDNSVDNGSIKDDMDEDIIPSFKYTGLDVEERAIEDFMKESFK